jgi:FixJ family two-component response regulator
MARGTIREDAAVLVIDDDPALAQSLKFAFEVDGLRVSTFPDAESVLEADLPKRGCLVIDMKLPGLDGLALLKALRSKGVTLPAVLITTNPPLVLKAQAARAGLPIVEKPLLQDELIETVRDLLKA